MGIIAKYPFVNECTLSSVHSGLAEKIEEKRVGATEFKRSVRGSR